MSNRQSLLQREIQQRVPFASSEAEAFLNLERTCHLVSQAFANRMKPFGLTPTQYNVLRILRGSHPNPLACGEIGQRMVTPMPDVTRLVDRLEKLGLVERQRDRLADRRVVLVGIRPCGLELLTKLDAPVLEWLKELLGHLDENQLATLTKLLELARQAVPSEDANLKEAT